jgi:carboxymethylenebutenolidase
MNPAMQVEIVTVDGTCPVHVLRPGGHGPWPAVLVFMDGIGMRPALVELGERLARVGYFVLLPDLFYRAGPYEPLDPAKLFGDPEARKVWFAKFAATATVDNIMRDTRAFVAYLAAQPDARQPKIGTVGYCMGGRMSLHAAARFADRVAAAASYHGGNLATDAPDSPHLVADKIRARVYVAQAENDPADQTQELDAALTSAKVDHMCETYPAKHGWVPRDTPVHNPAQAERHWQTLIDLFDATLKV